MEIAIYELKDLNFWDWSSSNTGQLLLPLVVIFVYIFRLKNHEFELPLRRFFQVFVLVSALALPVQIISRVNSYNEVGDCIHNKCYSVAEGIVQSVSQNERYVFITINNIESVITKVENHSARSVLNDIKVLSTVKLYLMPSSGEAYKAIAIYHDQ